jgi:hypothetical protein
MNTRATRDVSVALTHQEARMMRHRAEREIKLLRVQAQREDRKLTDDERANVRRYHRIMEQVDLALIEAGYD